MTPTCTSDLLIIGGGPAGLSSAINGASEGLNVRLLDAGSVLGGQAKESSAIENYPGFPEGITGNDLMGRMSQQVRKFAASIIAPVSAARLNKNDDGTITVTTDDYSEYTSKAVLLTMGLSYRRLNADGIGNFMGRGVYYGVPSFKPPVSTKVVAVIGGANSAGQAALGLAHTNRLDVKLLVRSTLEKGMSTYLITRIRAHPRIEVIEHCDVRACTGGHCLTCITITTDGGSRDMLVEAMHIFIGAAPRTMWLRGDVDMDDHNFVVTGHKAHRDQTYYETSMPGVFAAGDVRSGSTKRIATAVGEGAGALQMIHGYLGALA